MRHKVFGRKLSRDKNERKSLFKNLISSLVIHGQIKTTEAKAKAIRGLIDKLVSQAKKKTVQARRLIGAFLPDKKVVNKLVDEIAVKFDGRPGGYTRMTRIGSRSGDKAMIVKLEFVEGKQVPLSNKLPHSKTVRYPDVTSGKFDSLLPSSELSSVSASRNKEETVEIKKEVKAEKTIK